MWMETERVTGVRDYDRVTVNNDEQVRRRVCSCGNTMEIQVGLDKANRPNHITCVNGAYLRENGNEFALGGEWGERTSTFLYCSGCRRRRAWTLFK